MFYYDRWALELLILCISNFFYDRFHFGGSGNSHFFAIFSVLLFCTFSGFIPLCLPPLLLLSATCTRFFQRPAPNCTSIFYTAPYINCLYVRAVKIFHKCIEEITPPPAVRLSTVKDTLKLNFTYLTIRFSALITPAAAWCSRTLRSHLWLLKIYDQQCLKLHQDRTYIITRNNS